MAIEFTQRSKIDGYPLGAVTPNERSLALNAREAGNAFHARHKQAAGSATWNMPVFVLILVQTLALIACLTVARLDSFNLTVNMEFEMNIQIRTRSNRICRTRAFDLSHAQFAVSQVARKAIHWQPTVCECYRNSNMAIEFTQRSKIDGYPLGAVTFNSGWMRAS